MENPLLVEEPRKTEQEQPTQQQEQQEQQAQQQHQQVQQQQAQQTQQEQAAIKPPEPTPARLAPKADFIAFFDAQIEQAHDALTLFQKESGVEQRQDDGAAPTETTAPQSGGVPWKWLLILAGALAGLALAAPFIRKLFGGQGDDGGWRRFSSSPIPPQPSQGGAAQVPEPSTNESKPEPEPMRRQDLVSMALGKW